MRFSTHENSVIAGFANKSPRPFLVPWREATEPIRPALIFIPGFLSEQDPHQSFEPWTTQMLSIAEEHDLAAYGLFWGAQRLRNILLSSRLASGLLRYFSQAPTRKDAAFYLSLGLGASLSDLWRDAVLNADGVAVASEQWLGPLDRQVILVGHSLGARIAINVAVSGISSKILRVVAMAPAMTINNQHHYKFIADGQKFKGLVLHSKKDRVLRYLFRGGEATTNLPLGVNGVPEEHRRYLHSVDVSRHLGRSIRHSSYAVSSASLIRTALDECGIAELSTNNRAQ